MATSVFSNPPSRSWNATRGWQSAGPFRLPAPPMRRSRGFIAQSGELLVETRKGLAGMHGVLVALALEFLAVMGVGFAVLLWLWFR